MLTLTGISYTYPSMSEPLFERVSASFQQGWTAVLGDNGLGKTTLLNIAIGMLPADTGSINPDPHGLTIATCQQDNMVRPKNLDDFATDWSPGTMRVRNALHIGDDWPYRYETLSGGETKRLQVACAIAARPDVLVLDEPTAGLDPAGRDEIFELVRSYHKQSGATILIVSHSMEDIAQVADRLLVMNHAKVLFCDTPREVFSHADEIIAAGLDIPMITKVMLELKKRGHDVDTSVYTVAQAMDALRACKRKEAAHEC